MAEQLFADVLVEVPGIGLDRKFQYRVPQHLIPSLRFGHRVKIPFGGRRVTGFVVGLSNQKVITDVKDIIALVDQNLYFTEDQFALARWIANYYFCSTLKALQSVISPVLRKTVSRRVARFFCDVEQEDVAMLRHEIAHRAPKSLAVLETALKHPGLTKGKLAEIAGASPPVVDRLVSKKLLRVETEIVTRDPYPLPASANAAMIKLTAEQRRAVQNIQLDMQARRHQVFLLHGVTGSGKTEVYLSCIEHVLRNGRQAITLVPEISLTPQMVKLYKARFGRDVAVLHSRMSDGERYDEWVRIESGQAPVILGARSAILAPVPDPGLIIIDEEHEWSYKQEEAPRYHARAVALYRSKKSGGVLVLGSATPSLESYCRALPGSVYKLVSMPKRINHHGMPAVQIVDMREEVRAGNGGIFSLKLLQKLRQRLHNKELSIIFLNRRGFNTLVVCRECGLVLKCPHCEISLTYHSNGQLRCHYCNYQVESPKLCPDCSCNQIGYFGMGTQRVQNELQKALPGARVLRMDADTTSRKGSHQQILESFGEGNADILVGTQMVAKGLDIAGVTLVGVINADINLKMPDFRAGERTFQLLAQVAGRAGRGDNPGEVLIQTYTPDHYSIQAASHHNYEEFFRQEFTLRKEMGYPPFAKMVRLMVNGKDENAVQNAAENLRARLEGVVGASNGGKIFIVGPAPAALTRIKDSYRWHIIAWSADYKRLRKAMEKFWRDTGGVAPVKGVNLSIDVDPMSIT